MGKISLEKRKKATRNIIAWFLNRIEKDGISDVKVIQLVYNSAIRDVNDALDVYIEKTPEHSVSLRALKEELRWVPLVTNDSP